jgi:hypothetical protein
MSKIICNVPSVCFYQGDCGMCPGSENLIKNTEQRFEEYIDNISYRQWMATDRSTVETTVQSYSDFLESFAEKLNVLLCHSFIA